MIQSVKDKTEEITQKLRNSQIQSGQILNDMRKATAEQGVSQQAIYFKEEAEEHKKLSNPWKWVTLYMAIVFNMGTLPVFHRLICEVSIHPISYLYITLLC